MKVVILCGGKGTRLREETEFRPKAMVPVGGQPILWHIMKMYAHFGHREFILCLGYKAEMIREYFRNYLWNTCDATLKLGRAPHVRFHNRHEEEDWSVTLANTGDETLTGYRVKAIQKYIEPGETFLLTYGDGVSDIDINESIRSHENAGKICTISAVHPAGRFGALMIDGGGTIHTFKEKPRFEAAYINGGFMVCDYRLFDYVTADPDLMFEQKPISDLVRDKQLNSYKHESFWQAMDNYQEMQYLNQLWQTGEAPWKVWKDKACEVASPPSAKKRLTESGAKSA
jgi:glucose-1-phosphate cytidylyltransferase